MAIAMTLQQYLDDKHIDYDVMTHERTENSSRAAQASHVPGDRLVKAVILSREGGFIAALIPASCKVRLDAVRELVDGPVALSSEDEIEDLFPDCDRGAIPPLVNAYGIDMIVDERLGLENGQGDGKADDVYFEAGDHQSLIHLTGRQFRELLREVPCAPIADRPGRQTVPQQLA